MRVVSRIDAIDEINGASGLSGFDKAMLLSLDPNEFNYSDKDLAIRWFLLFGEIVSVDGAHIADLLMGDMDKAKEIALKTLIDAGRK